MGTRSFSDAELLELHKQGLRPADIARRLGVGRAAVSKRLKKLREQVVPEVVKEFGLVGNSGTEVINRGLNAMDQLLKINGIVNRELDFLQESIAKCDPLQRPALQKQQLQHIAEVRAQISLMAQIAQTSEIWMSKSEKTSFRLSVSAQLLQGLLDSANKRFARKSENWAYEYVKQRYVEADRKLGEYLKEFFKDDPPPQMSEERRRQWEEWFERDIRRLADWYKETFPNLQAAIEYDKRKKENLR
jgi:predicted transcriptional regulator